MAKPSRATQAKRGRERANQEKQQGKREDRALRKEQKKVVNSERLSADPDYDPDLDGIYPGPQPPAEED